MTHTTKCREHKRGKWAHLHLSNTLFILSLLLPLKPSIKWWYLQATVWRRICIKHLNIKKSLLVFKPPKASSRNIHMSFIFPICCCESKGLTCKRLQRRLNPHITTNFSKHSSCEISQFNVSKSGKPPVGQFMVSMLYTEKSVLPYYVRFLQIRSHILLLLYGVCKVKF